MNPTNSDILSNEMIGVRCQSDRIAGREFALYLANPEHCWVLSGTKIIFQNYIGVCGLANAVLVICYVLKQQRANLFHLLSTYFKPFLTDTIHFSS